VEVPSKKTAFILGAGASQPFGFPTGRDLYHDLVRHLVSRHELSQRLQQFGDFSEAEIKEFRSALSKSGRISVDTFLEHRPEFMDIGKSAIAARLIACENSDTLFGDAGKWMGYLFNHLENPFGKDRANSNVAFITFNYDRSFEHFLFTAFKNSFWRKDADCTAALHHIPIIHLHGTLGRLPWQEGEGSVRPYEDLVNTESLAVAKHGIKIVHEDLEDGRDKDFDRAKAILAWAQQIYFLGFGYGATNMKRLGLRDLDKVATGTGTGLTDSEIGRVRALTDSKVSPENFDCLGFLRNRVNWGVVEY
jgi:hypothetical protein